MKTATTIGKGALTFLGIMVASFLFLWCVPQVAMGGCIPSPLPDYAIMDGFFAQIIIDDANDTPNLDQEDNYWDEYWRWYGNGWLYACYSTGVIWNDCYPSYYPHAIRISNSQVIETLFEDWWTASSMDAYASPQTLETAYQRGFFNGKLDGYLYFILNATWYTWWP